MNIPQGFALMPGWLLALRSSDPKGTGLDSTAIHAYLVMALYGKYVAETGMYEECRPSAATLAEVMHVSPNTARRALADLVSHGAAVKVARFRDDGSQLPNVYRLNSVGSQPPTHQLVGGYPPVGRGVPTDGQGGVPTSGQGGYPPAGTNPEVINPEPEHPEKNSSANTAEETPQPEETPRPDVNEIINYLADKIEANGSKRPTRSKKSKDEARLLIDKDGRTVKQIKDCIDWCQADDFWRTVILSMPKLRKHYDAMRLAATSNGGRNGRKPYQDPVDPDTYYADPFALETQETR